MAAVNSFDIDGVIWLPAPYRGLKPEPQDVIITGRSIEERPETERFLASRGIANTVHFNPAPFQAKTRASSGAHKASVLRALLASGVHVGIHFEDDPVQAQIIQDAVPAVTVVRVCHRLVEVENVRRPEE